MPARWSESTVASADTLKVVLNSKISVRLGNFGKDGFQSRLRYEKFGSKGICFLLLLGVFVDFGVVVQHKVPKFMRNVEPSTLWRLLPRSENEWLRPVPC